MPIFDNHKQQNSGGINNYNHIDNSVHQTNVNTTSSSSQSNSNTVALIFIVGAAIPFFLIGIYPKEIAFLSQYSGIVNLIILLISISITAYTFIISKKIKYSITNFVQSIMPIIIQWLLIQQNTPFIEKVTTFSNNHPNIFSYLDIMQDIETRKLILYVLLNNVAIVFLVIVILALLLEIFRNKNFRSYYSVIIYILEIIILCFSPTLIS
ncbi:hypothetical protein [Ligilactobacillus salivarius]|nr:hypothetical protein [Ligilactobacillus salivarius]MDM8284585.1 hypothetical protein [Ligilactobacillus salivarius]